MSYSTLCCSTCQCAGGSWSWTILAGGMVGSFCTSQGCLCSCSLWRRCTFFLELFLFGMVNWVLTREVKQEESRKRQGCNQFYSSLLPLPFIFWATTSFPLKLSILLLLLLFPKTNHLCPQTNLYFLCLAFSPPTSASPCLAQQLLPNKCSSCLQAWENQQGMWATQWRSRHLLARFNK